MKVLFSIICVTLLISACNTNSRSQKEQSEIELSAEHDSISSLTTAQKIANSHGIAHWQEVSVLNFTFNVDRGENHFDRSWTWNPKTADVVMRSADDTIRYNRNRLDSLSMKTDASFINDKYWLLAPFNLVWDGNTVFSEKLQQRSPIKNEILDVLTITYGDEGGYTPGDAYDFYYGKDYKIKEWVFRKGNDSVPSMITTWEAYKNYKGLEIATMHADSLGNFKLHFTNISVKLTP